VNGASGGTGVWIVQLAKLAGAQVVGTCGPSNVDFVRSLGANTVINYRTTDLAKWAGEDSHNKVDLVIDCSGGKSLENAWKAVRGGGLVITIVPPADGNYNSNPSPPEGVSKTIKGKFFVMEPDGAQLEQCTKWIEEGKAKAVVDSVWEFEDYKKAFERVDSGHARGKVVLKVKSKA
jgi:NADPH:quinone reductase-like Zn-dependent oxidoreductase